MATPTPTTPDLSKLTDVQKFIYNKTVEEYCRVSDALKKPDCMDREMLEMRQLKLCRDLQYLHLTPEDKVNMYLEGRGAELPPDGCGKDEICGKILPTEEEVAIGMYPDRSLYYFQPFTCGIYMFYTDDMKFRYIGMSKYIEYAVHAYFTTKHRDKPMPVRWMLRHYPQHLRFKIIDRVPYSLLSTALRYNRVKYKCMYQYDFRHKNVFDPNKLINGEYNY